LEFKIGRKKIGGSAPCYIIAEIGINHNNSLETAKQLIREVAKAGCNAAKFQSFKAESLYSKKAGKLKWGKGKNKYSYDIFKANKRFQLPNSWYKELIKECKRNKISFLSSAWDKASADRLEKLGLNAFKIGSSALTNTPLIEHIAKKKKPMLISTGGASFEEIVHCANSAKKHNSRIALLHCHLKYPTKPKNANIAVIEALKKEFPEMVIGYSDHTMQAFDAPAAAVAKGAKVIEKHITLNKKMPGPDHFFALEPQELREMVLRIRAAEKKIRHGQKPRIKRQLLGKPEIRASADEQYLRNFAFQTIISVKKIKKGQKLSKANIRILRPGQIKRGLEPKFFPEILGKKAAKTIPAGKPITWQDIKGQRAGAVIQARAGSTRLPKKAFAKIAGSTLTEHVIQRTKQAKALESVVVAVPDTEQNRPLIKTASGLGTKAFAGPEKNVLERTIRAAEENGLSQIVRICGDSPLIDPAFIDLAVKQHLLEENDYTTAVGILPEGLDFEVVSLKALKRARKASKSARHREHVTLFIRENPKKFRAGMLAKGKWLYRHGLKLTVDRKQDLQLMKALAKKKNFSKLNAKSLVSLFDKKRGFFKNVPEKKPLVSVMVNTYNYGKTLERALQSALNQSLGKDKYEVLVTDDGSTDSSWEILAKHRRQIDARWQKNQGAYAANNKNFERAKGKYVIKLDADDLFEKTILEKMLAALEKNKKAGFACCDIVHVRNGKKKTVSLKKFHVFKTIACGIMFKKSAIKNAGKKMYNPILFFCEYDLLLRLLKESKGIYIPGTCYYYFRHKKSLTADPKKVKKGLEQLKRIHGIRVSEKAQKRLIS
jgi:N-acetylneuraminate synthase